MEEISARKMVDVALEGHEKRILHSDCRWDGTRFACYSNTELDFNSVDLCFDKQSTNWKALTKRTQAVIVTAATSEAYVVQMWTFLVVLVMFGWPVIKKLNLLTLNLLGAFLDSCYRLYLQVYGNYMVSWRSLPLNGLFVSLLLMNSLLLQRITKH